MKKLSGLLPVFAIATGVALAAVTSAFKSSYKQADNNYTFKYNGQDYSSTEVADIDNWQLTSNEESCDAEDEVPCTITVPPSSVDTTGATIKLDAGFAITPALNNSTSTYYVGSQSAGTHINRSN